MDGNSFISWVLRSPLHRLLSGGMLLITVTGCKTGKKYTLPVGYYREGDSLWVISSRDRTWWLNVKQGAQVNIRLQGKEVNGFAEAILDEGSVAARVGEYLRHVPMAARPLGVRMEGGVANPEDAMRLAKERLFVRIRVS
jgi:deazaflavin-dependent oxidoreductase (nitroreductase family)